MSSILYAKHVSFEHSVSSPRSVITSRREEKNNKAKVFQHPIDSHSQSASSCLISPHFAAGAVGVGRGAASFLATESTGTVLIPRLMTRIAGHVFCVTKNGPYTCGNFHACAITRFQKPQQLGRARTACSSIVTSRAQRAWPRSGRPGLLQAASETSGIEDSIASCSSSSSLHRGWSARMATRWSSQHPACSIRYRSPHVSSSANDSFKKYTGARSRRPPPFTLFALSLNQKRRSSFYSERGENLVTIARFGKPLFANMHHHVDAVAGALRKPNVACPRPDVSTGWPVMWWMLSSHSAAASDSVLTFHQPNGFFVCQYAPPRWFNKCAKSHGDSPSG